MKKLIAIAAAVLVAVGLMAPTGSFAGSDVAHRVVIHVDDNDAKRMNLALNNARNVDAYYKEKGEDVVIEIVAYGPGLHMLRSDTSPVKKRIISFGQNYENISFLACGNTKSSMEKKSGKKVPIMSEATMVKAGVVHLMERQEQGWSYIRP